MARAQGFVGRPILAKESPPLLRGEGHYIGDIAAELGAHYLYFVRSPYAAAKILSIDIPDGIEAITGADLAHIAPIGGRIKRPNFKPVLQPILPTDTVHFAGQAVLAVIAPTLAEAEDLGESVFVDYEPLPPVIDFDFAMEPEAPVVNQQVPGNCILDARFETPALDEAMGRAAEVIDVHVRSHREHPLPLETRGIVAHHDRIGGRTRLYVTSQKPHLVRTGIADSLQIPESDVQVIAPDMGGGFGNKAQFIAEQVVLAWAARKFAKPIAWLEDRRDALGSSTHGRGNSFRVRGGFTADGRLVALDADVNTNTGAFSHWPMTGALEALQVLHEMPGIYKLEECRIRSKAVLTNSCSVAGNRGVARPNIILSLERLMDVAARRFGMSPVEIRKKNLVDTFPYKSLTGLVYDAGSYIECLERAEELVDLKSFRERQAELAAAGRYIGVGFSSFSERTGYGSAAFTGRGNEVVMGYERVEMEMDPSGNVLVRIGASPHGQGLATTLSQVIADELASDPEKIRVIHGDTDRTPYGAGTGMSRAMVISGGACLIAARELGAKLRRIAAHILEASTEDVELRDGRATIVGTDRGVALEEIARAAHHQPDRVPPGEELGLASSGFYDPVGTFANACFVAEVEVDAATGHVDVTRFLAVEDAGKIVNPLIADGQLRGGIVHGIGGALLEELIYDEDGTLLTSSLMDYLVPTVAEVPPVEIHHLETISDATITGAKGLGEGGSIGAPAAVVNAISDALQPFGVELFETPATPERIRAAIVEAGRANVASHR
jgi:carbon-monoxide dehydrogenase large subunit